MVIRPSDPEPSRRSSASGAESAAAQPAKQRPPKPANVMPPAPAPAQTDRTELSGAARELLGQLAGAAPPTAALSPERTHQVLERMRSGHYDRPEVLDQVAQKVQADAALPGTDD
jgi:hypothetical protein